MEVRPITQTFAANVATLIPIAGRYVRVTASVNPFTLRILSQGRQPLATIPSALVGDSAECKAGEPDFDAIEITTTGNESVSLLITDGTVRRDSQNTDVSDRAARLLGVVYGSLAVPLLQILSNGLNLLGALIHGTLGAIAQAAIGGVNALVMTERGFTYGASFVTSTGVTAGTSQTVFSAASNTNGAILWSAGKIATNATAVTAIRFAAHTAAPNGLANGDSLAMTDSGCSIAGTFSAFASLKRAVFIPAGKGVYIDTGVTDTGSFAQALYTLL